MTEIPEGRAFLPYGRQSVSDEDVAAVAEVLRSDFLTTGPTAARLEGAFASAVGADWASAVSSGTAALHLAALAADVGPGDLCIVPTISFVATANAYRMVGAEVLFADVDADSGLMGPDHLEAAFARADGRPVKAVSCVHMGGQTADLAGLAEIAARHGAILIEDACHALGATYSDPNANAHRVGDAAYARACVFSLHPVKAMTMGEGGLVTTNDRDLHERVCRLRSHGLTKERSSFASPHQATDAKGRENPWYYEMQEVGYNYRASDIHCALGLSQLARLADFVAARQALVDRYEAGLAGLAPLVRPVARMPFCTPAWHLMTVLIDFQTIGASRAEVMQRLRTAGIGSQVHYIPIHRQPYYRERYGALTLPEAEAYYARCLSLPLWVGMSPEDVDRVIDALVSIVRLPTGTRSA